MNYNNFDIIKKLNFLKENFEISIEIIYFLLKNYLYLYLPRLVIKISIRNPIDILVGIQSFKNPNTGK